MVSQDLKQVQCQPLFLDIAFASSYTKGGQLGQETWSCFPRISSKLNAKLNLQITFSNNALLIEFLVGSSFLDLSTRKSAFGMPEKWAVMGKQEIEVFQMPVGRFFAPTYELA